MNNLNEILGRDQIYQKIKTILEDFQEHKKDITIKRGIYIYMVTLDQVKQISSLIYCASKTTIL